LVEHSQLLGDRQVRQFLAKRAFAFLNRCRPHLLFQELLLELLPIATQTVPRENFSYLAKIDGVSVMRPPAQQARP
jgi:hypothetical protein